MDRQAFKYMILLSFLMALSIEFNAKPIYSQDEGTYCATWSCSLTPLEKGFFPPINFPGTSVRQIVHVSIGGELIRVKFSNRYGREDLVIKAARIANTWGQGNGNIVVESDTAITFGGDMGIIIPPGGETYSDTFIFSLRPESLVAISIFFGNVPQRLTGHPYSFTTTFFESGINLREPISSEYTVEHWYFIEAIEVSSTPQKSTIVCFGDSLTDGDGSSIDKHSRWTDILSFQLRNHKATKDIGIVNAGLSRSLLTFNAGNRFSTDALRIRGSRIIIINYGIEEFIFLGRTPEGMINTFKTLIKMGHRANKLVFGATITPFGNSDIYSKEREELRTSINQWIRSATPEEGGFDEIIDFDKIVRDPIDHSTLDLYFDSGDGIHPNDDGYEMMAYGIEDFSIFLEEPHFNIYDLIDSLKVVDVPGVKIQLQTAIQAESEIEVIIIGSTQGSYGFRVWTMNQLEERTSNYYKTGAIEKGMFELTAKLKTVGSSSFILIKGPMSTINIDDITIDVIVVIANGSRTVYDPIEAKPYEE